MSKRGYIARYLLILKKLNTTSCSSYQELKNYIENNAGYYQALDETLEVNFSKRTLQRDIREIRNLWGCSIEYSRQEKGYYIASDDAANTNFQRMIEAFDMFNSLTLSQDMEPFVYIEKRKPQGTENLSGLIHAIRDRHKINFSYHKFWEDIVTKRLGDPYALKEFRDRWYVLVKDNKDNKIKTFALDRLSELEITREKFQRPKDFNVQQDYRYYFGIITPEGEEPKDIILSFDPVQGKYIKTLPLHETQEILADNKDEVQIKLRLCITQDFIMELLSFGNRVKVLKPKPLATQIKKAHYEAYKNY